MQENQEQRPPSEGEVNRVIDDIKRLRDEIKLRIHLGQMDAKDAWRKLEPHIDKLDRRLDAAGDRVTEELKNALDQARKSIQALRDKL